MTAEEKYAEAISLYKTTSLTLKEISEKCGVTRSGLSSFIRRNHRSLMYRRHGLHTDNAGNRMWSSKGQTPASRSKYREAIEACDSIEYIELNVSQIARLFNLSGPALANQLRSHYPDVIERRERERRRRGIADNHQRGVQCSSVEEYSESVRLLKETDMTIKEAAEACRVSFSGLRNHILNYHKHPVNDREKRRLDGKQHPKIGRTDGNGSLRLPDSENAAKYADAVEMYRTTTLTVKEICRITGNDAASFSNYMRSWHRDLIFLRRGVRLPESTSDRLPISSVRRSDPSTRVKYASAVKLLHNGGDSVEGVARKFGFNPEVFRTYLKNHYPELWSEMGMTTLGDGRKVLRRSAEKYAGAIEIYRTTKEPLKSIAQRLGIKYSSISGFVRRNMPEVIEEHRKLCSLGN